MMNDMMSSAGENGLAYAIGIASRPSGAAGWGCRLVDRHSDAP
jgi:hypothetical protein